MNTSKQDRLTDDFRRERVFPTVIESDELFPAEIPEEPVESPPAARRERDQEKERKKFDRVLTDDHRMADDFRGVGINGRPRKL